MKKVLATIFILVFAFVGFLILQNQEDDHQAGQVKILVHDGEEIVIEDTVSFSEGETLFDMLDGTYDLLCANVSYQPTEDCKEIMFGSPVILGVEGVLTNWTSSYFAIYINDDYSTLGVGNIYLEDGDLVQLKVQYLGGE